jgi:hypothetical protein
MSSYIRSNANRHYAAIEASYARVPAITGTSRLPAFRLNTHQAVQALARKDKTGSRSAVDVSANARRLTAFELETYLISWNGTGEPAYGPLFQAALGEPVSLSTPLIIASVAGAQITTVSPHNLGLSAAVSFDGEIRFVTTTPDPRTILLNAPFLNQRLSGATLQPTATYRLAGRLPSLALFDFWDPISTVSRVVTGAGVDTMQIVLDAEYHELTFAGPAADLLDSVNFTAGNAGLTPFAIEPIVAPLLYSVVAGHVGELWIGLPASQFLTLTTASITLRNNLALRNRDTGSRYPQALAPGQREVLSRFTLLARDDAQSIALYAAAKQRVSVPMMLQLGRQQGQMMAIFMPRMTPELPLFGDSGARLEWEFRNNLAQGVANDELVIAFA